MVDFKTPRLNTEQLQEAASDSWSEPLLTVITGPGSSCQAQLILSEYFPE